MIYTGFLSLLIHSGMEHQECLIPKSAQFFFLQTLDAPTLNANHFPPLSPHLLICEWVMLLATPLCQCGMKARLKQRYSTAITVTQRMTSKGPET